MSTPPLQQRYPFDLGGKVHPDVEAAIRYSFSGLLDLNEALRVTTANISKLQTTAAAATTPTPASSSSTVFTSGVTSFNTQTGAVIYFPPLGTVSNQSGLTTYTIAGTDAGALIVLDDASAIAVTLSTMSPPWFCFVFNSGVGTATLTPSTGTVNGNATLTLATGQGAIVFFDGTNWWAVTTPLAPNTIAPVAGEFLTGYDASTGIFSQAAPTGLSVTITTAKLTTGGTEGSQVFTNGILTAQTPAT